MITRFEVRGISNNELQLEDELSLAASRIISVLGPESIIADSHWECVNEVIKEKAGLYKGKIEMHLRTKQEQEEIEERAKEIASEITGTT